MTLFEPGEPNHQSSPHSKSRAERATGVAYILGVVAAGLGVIYLMSFLMGD
jgi:hypothetical protein